MGKQRDLQTIAISIIARDSLGGDRDWETCFTEVLHAQINICACAVCGLVTGTLYAVPSTLIACATLMPDPAGGLAAKTKDKTKGHHQFSRTMGKFVVRQTEKVNKGVSEEERGRESERGKPAKDLRGRSISRIHAVSAADAFCSGACVSLTRLDLQVHWTRTEGQGKRRGRLGRRSKSVGPLSIVP